ncbi:MAG TPA: DUF4157 domain-containing protein [Nostocaceae cyanobacterium]|nr:DUF4157 domain-containing protein [Nostocaceae cyanobacterium]
MRSLQLKPNSTFVPLSTNLAAKNSSTSNLTSLQARANLSKVDDLSAVSSILKAQYKRLQASKLQAQNPELEEEKQGKSQASKSRLQSKGDWQKKANLSTIFGGSGSSLSSGLMGKYEKLMPGISLGHVKVFQGSSVDQALHQAGLQGLTDGTRVAVSSKAQAGTLEHELGHVAQRQVQGFNLNESSRAGYEQDADRISANLVNNQPVKLQGLTQGKNTPSKKTQSNVLEAKCEECDKEGQPKPELLAKTVSISGNNQLQAFNFYPLMKGYWQEYLTCYFASAGAFVTGTLSLLKECGAQAAKSVGNALMTIGVWFGKRGDYDDGNFFGWLGNMIASVGYAISLLQSSVMTLAICAVTVIGLVISLLGILWCLISATYRCIDKAQKRIQELEKEQRERQNDQRIQQELQNTRQDVNKLTNTVQKLQQQTQQAEQVKNAILDQHNALRRQQGKKPCTLSGNQIVCP